MKASEEERGRDAVVRVAVIGSGIAGLGCAWLLADEDASLESRDAGKQERKKHEVTIFEAAATLGMDQHSLTVMTPESDVGARIDVPLRVFSESYYPNLANLYTHTGISFQAENYASTFVHPGRTPRPFFRYRNLLLVGRRYSVPFVLLPLWIWLSFPALLHFLRLVLDYLLLSFALRFRASAAALHRKTIREWMDGVGLSRTFQDEVLVPAVSIMCTCSRASAELYPAELMVDYLRRRSMGGVRRVVLGTREVVKRLSRSCHVSTNMRVTRVVRRSSSSKWAVFSDAVGSEVQEFDHVVFATQAYVPLAVVEGLSAEAQAALRGFSYERSTVVVHSDPKLMPADRGDWSPVNVFLESAPTDSAPMATIWLNKAAPSCCRGTSMDIFQTWNPHREPEPGRLHSSAFVDRPVHSVASLDAITSLQSPLVQGANGLWFAGSHTLRGVPLLESAVLSGLLVAESISHQTRRRPWATTHTREASSARHSACRLPWWAVLLAAWVLASFAFSDHQL
eukprot:ANDGO_04666.mRNA.1 hypothetical protein